MKCFFTIQSHFKDLPIGRRDLKKKGPDFQHIKFTLQDPFDSVQHKVQFATQACKLYMTIRSVIICLGNYTSLRLKNFVFNAAIQDKNHIFSLAGITLTGDQNFLCCPIQFSSENAIPLQKQPFS